MPHRVCSCLLMQVGELVEENVEDQLDVANKKDFEKLKVLGTALLKTHSL